MTEQNKIRSHIEKYVVTYLFIALSVLFVVASKLDINYVASQLLLRLNRNAFIVLALIIPIVAGMDINFAITIGAMAAQIGLLLTISWGVSGVPGILLAAASSMPGTPVTPQLMVSSRPICAAMAPMVMAKLMPMPAMMGMISASTMNAFLFRRSSSWLAT